MNIANPIVLLLLFPTALETKSKFLGKACKPRMGGSCAPPQASPPPASWSSCSHPVAQALCGMLLPTHFCLSSFQSQSKGHRCSLTHSPLHPPRRTEQDPFCDSLNLAQISIIATYFGLMHLTIDLSVSD